MSTNVPVRIERLNTRYRAVPGSPRRDELDRLLRVVLDEALEPAIERVLNATPFEEVCIRRVDVPVGLAIGSRSHAALAGTWAAAIAAGVEAQVRGGGAGVVRYGSRRHALLDMAIGIARGDRSREWAWRSLRLWAPGAHEESAALTTALLDDEAAIAPVLAAVARAGALAGLAEALPDAAWPQLAAASLRSAGASPSLAERIVVEQEPAWAHAAGRAGRVLDRSTLTVTLRAAGVSAAVVAAFALVETEPALVTELGTWLQPVPVTQAPSSNVAPSPSGRPAGWSEPAASGDNDWPAATSADGGPDAACAGGTGDLPAAASDAAGAEPAAASDGPARTEAAAERSGRCGDGPAPPHRGPAEVRPAAASDRPTGAKPAAERGVRSGDGPEPPHRGAASGQPAAARGSREEIGAEPGSAASDDGTVPVSPVASAAEQTLPVPSRACASSAFGGLVFGLHAVVALGLPARLAAELPGVDLRAALHAIALKLCAAEPGDPAALAFAGVGPDHQPPAPVGAEVDRTGAIATAAGDIAGLLAARLEIERDALDLDELLRRRAEIVSDPGWIEVHLLLDELDTAVRRAALDVDPGHLPFLGCVVRIVYV
jgi:hypothetical protein